MTVLVNDSLGSDSGNWAGATRTITGGTLLMTEDGIVRNTTNLTGTETWSATTLESAPDGNSGPAVSDASGNGLVFNLNVSGPDLIVDYIVRYDTHTSFNTFTDINVNLGTYNASNIIGVTFDLDNDTARFWNGTTAAEPTAVGTWDGNGPDGTVDYGASGYTQDGNYCGWGNWTTGTPIAEITIFTAGNIAGATADVGSPSTRLASMIYRHILTR